MSIGKSLRIKRDSTVQAAWADLSGEMGDTDNVLYALWRVHISVQLYNSISPILGRPVLSW